MRQAVMTVCCSACRSLFRVARPEAVRLPQPRVDRPRVLIAHESPAFCEAVRTVLNAEPWEIAVCHDGVSALDLLRSRDMAVALLDVALPGRYGFEVCEELRSNPSTAGVKVLLFASIYDKTRYKRLPRTLYGADDYIEKHHIPDLLVGKVRALLSGEDASVAPVPGEDRRTAPQMPAQELDEARALLKQVEEAATTVSPSAPAPLPEAHVKARRLARIIASDIALYNQEAVEEGVRTGTFFTLLANDIAEGRSFYRQRVAEEIRNTTNYLDDAFTDLIAKVRKELDL
jgi:DNA-binding response OmpR family regulator